jgi:hypothetical protein
LCDWGVEPGGSSSEESEEQSRWGASDGCRKKGEIVEFSAGDWHLRREKRKVGF